MKKSSLMIYGTLGAIVLMITIAIVFFRQEPAKEADPQNDSTPAVTEPEQEQNDTASDTESGEEPQQEEVNQQRVLLEADGVREKGLTNEQINSLEQVKDVTLEFFHKFDKRLVKGEEAIQWQKKFYEVIKNTFTGVSLQKYSPQEIAKYYQRNNMYSSLGKGKNKLLEFKLIKATVKKVEYLKEFGAYAVTLEVKTNQNTGFFGAALKKKNGAFKIAHTPDATFINN
jgi:cytoskeletal protein RodZ